jgi:hypothetical protein
MTKKKKDFEEEIMTFDYEEDVFDDEVNELLDEEIEILSDDEIEEVVLTHSKTFFDFTYDCSHGGKDHCVKCYDKAKGH